MADTGTHTMDFYDLFHSQFFRTLTRFGKRVWVIVKRKSTQTHITPSASTSNSYALQLFTFNHNYDYL